MTYVQVLRIAGLQPFFWTQFLGAFNDNVFRIIVSLAAVAAGLRPQHPARLPDPLLAVAADTLHLSHPHVGREHVPFRGPALLVSNHLSHVDGFLIGACVQRFIRFMVYRPYYEIHGINC